MGFTHQGSLGPLKGEAYRDNDRISVTDPLLAQAIWESGINRIFTDINVSGKAATGLNPNIRFYRYALLSPLIYCWASAMMLESSSRYWYKCFFLRTGILKVSVLVGISMRVLTSGMVLKRIIRC